MIKRPPATVRKECDALERKGFRRDGVVSELSLIVFSKKLLNGELRSETVAYRNFSGI